MEQELIRSTSVHPCFVWLCFAKLLVFFLMFMLPSSFSFWTLCCLSLFKLRLLITSLVSLYFIRLLITSLVSLYFIRLQITSLVSLYFIPLLITSLVSLYFIPLLITSLVSLYFIQCVYILIMRNFKSISYVRHST